MEEEQDETEKNDKQDKKRKLPIETPGQPKIASVDTWSQGPYQADQIKTMRTFNIKTPGQVRDYGKLVGDRKFQKFEELYDYIIEIRNIIEANVSIDKKKGLYYTKSMNIVKR